MIPEAVQQDPVAAAVAARFPQAVAGGKLALGELTLEITPDKIVEVCRYLKHEETFVRLSSVTCVDWHPSEPRFEVVYHLHSTVRNLRLRLKARTGGAAPEIDSVTCVWRGAGWYEREVYDLFGVVFRNHPNLKRIMMPDDWK
ncbi:MAG: NADH-quinone oxidoreductase subunit C, partial [Acidobacteria bacterium]|nr:NADH-quinone oxidoreductase subunit C [Acidobacteriota bacterium]